MKKRRMLTYAPNQAKELKYIKDVPNGDKCGCFCPDCGAPLRAKQRGEGKAPHFAHQDGSICEGAVESALHIMAKDILQEIKSVCLPGDGGRLSFYRVEEEFTDKDTNLRPDCIGYYGDKCLWIEFKKTHPVDPKKKGKIISAHIDCIEIDVNECELEPDKVRDFIRNSTEHRIWIRETDSKIKTVTPVENGANCDREEEDYYYDDYPLRQTLAKDENGRLVDLKNDDFDMQIHTYFCLSCGKELTVDVSPRGSYEFIHIDNGCKCYDEKYLREAAKAIVCDKFEHSNIFLLEVPQRQPCAEGATCQIFDKEQGCSIKKYLDYDLKEMGYTECIKEGCLPNSDYEFDLVFKNTSHPKDSIGVIFDVCYNGVDIPPMTNKIIVPHVSCKRSLRALQHNPLGDSYTEYINFKSDVKEPIERKDIKKYVRKFELFSSGKYYIETVACADADKKKQTTIYQLVTSNISVYEVDLRKFALFRCFDQKQEACYCEICFFFAQVGYLVPEQICKRYKTKRTPHYPMKEMPLNCPYFRLNSELKERITQTCRDIKYLERFIEKSIEKGDD